MLAPLRAGENPYPNDVKHQWYNTQSAYASQFQARKSIAGPYATDNNSGKQVERFNAYSMMVDPMTSCGCFECIVAFLPMCNGVMIVNREYSGDTPCGMGFSTLAGTVGGGNITPGFVGIGKVYITSKKFISADGGFARVVWMPKELKELLHEQMQARVDDLGLDGFLDMIADEEIGTSEEEILPFLEEKGHPALTMDPMLQ